MKTLITNNFEDNILKQYKQPLKDFRLTYNDLIKILKEFDYDKNNFEDTYEFIFIIYLNLKRIYEDNED